MLKETAQNLLESAFVGQRGTIRVSFDLTPDQLFHLLSAMEGPIKIKGKTRTMLEFDEVLEIIPVSRSTLVRMLARGTFPQGHYLSPNRRVWYEDDILAWQQRLNSTQRQPKIRAAVKRKPKPVPKKKKRATQRRRR